MLPSWAIATCNTSISSKLAILYNNYLTHISIYKVTKKETVSVVASPKRKTKQKEETHVKEEVEKQVCIPHIFISNGKAQAFRMKYTSFFQVRKHAHTATISLPLSKKSKKDEPDKA